MDEDKIDEKLTPWSISKAQMLDQCTQRFHWRYIEDKERDYIPHSAGRIGAVVHLVIEYMLEDEDRGFFDAFREAIAREGLTEKEIEKAGSYKDDVHGFLEKFRKWTSSSLDINELCIEKQVAVAKNLDLIDDYWSDEVFFRGVWDIGLSVNRNGKKYIIVMDHKTGRPKSLENYEKQLRSYMVTALAAYPNMAGAQSAIHWLQKPVDDAFDWGDMWSRQKIEDELLPWFYNYFKRARHKAHQPPEVQPGYYCDFCPFQYDCPAKN